jgi:hypothetical protein
MLVAVKSHRMAGRSAARHPLRYGVLAAVGTFAFLSAVLALLFAVPGHGQPVLCLRLSDRATVLSAAACPGHLLERKHIGAGTRVDLRDMAVRDRIGALWPPATGEVKLEFPGLTASVPFRAVRAAADPLMTALLVARTLALGLSLVIAGLLVVRVPSRMSWAFFLFIAFSAPSAQAAPALAMWNPYVALAAALAWQSLLMLAAVEFLVFVLRFPSDVAEGWLCRLERAAVAIFLAGAAVAVMPSVAFFLEGRPAHGWAVASEAALVAIFALALFVMIVKYRYASGADRHKLAFVLYCLAIGFTGFVADGLLGAFGFAGWLARASGLLTIVVPIGVAYAVVRHRVIDVRIAISHTVLYSAVTLTVISLFACLEQLLAQVYHERIPSSLGFGVDAALSVAVVVALNMGHERAMRWIENRVFRSRRIAEEQMTLLATSLLDEEHLYPLAEALACGPARALHLTSGAAFFRTSGRKFRRLGSYGWHQSDLHDADATSPIANLARTARHLVHVDHAAVKGTGIPMDDRRPEVALPLVLRGELVGFALYGAHENGAALDHEERALLDALATPATAAFDHAASSALRSRNRTLQWEVVRLRRRMGMALALVATIGAALVAMPDRARASQNVTPPNLTHVTQLKHVGGKYEDVATHFTGRVDEHWTRVSVGSKRVVVGLLDASAPIAGNLYDVLVFDGSGHLLATLPVPRRPLAGATGSELDIRYSVDDDAANVPCCRGDYLDVFVRIAGGHATVASRAYGPPIGASGAIASAAVAPGLQQTAAGAPQPPTLTSGLTRISHLAFGENGELWASDAQAIVAIDADERQIDGRRTFAAPCAIQDVAVMGEFAAVALSCGSINIVSEDGNITHVFHASVSAGARLATNGKTLWLVSASRACMLVPVRWCTALPGAGSAAVERDGALLVARARGASTAILRVGVYGTPKTLGVVPWRVGWLLSRDKPILIPASGAAVYALSAKGAANRVCTLTEKVRMVSVGGYGDAILALAGNALEMVRAAGCSNVERFPALHPAAFAVSGTLLAIGYDSPDIAFSAIPPASR